MAVTDLNLTTEVLAGVRIGEPISKEAAYQLIGASDEQLPELLAAALATKQKFKSNLITYSRKVFIPLTNLCATTADIAPSAVTPASPVPIR